MPNVNKRHRRPSCCLDRPTDQPTDRPARSRRTGSLVDRYFAPSAQIEGHIAGAQNTCLALGNYLERPGLELAPEGR